MLKILIVDDEKHVRESVTEMVADFPDIEICAECDNLAKTLAAIREYNPDVILLDIELGAENGFDIFNHFPNPPFKVIFITAYQEYALQAFRFSALDYLLKPIDPGLLSEALQKAGNSLDREKIAVKIDSFLHNNDLSRKIKKIVLKTADNIHVVSLNEVLYCEADRSYTTFYLIDKSRIVVSHTIGDYEELLQNYGFFRVHQSYLVNLNYLIRYEKADGGKAILKTGVSVPVATRKKDSLLQQLAKL